jgi:hypothetical protein
LLRRHQEIWYALIVMIAVTALYLLAYRQVGALPAASGLVGHGIGIVGFILMLMTEALYSIRKQLTDAKWGSMAGWLRFHIVTGLTGPYMVLLHTAMRFQGLAAVAMLLTVVVVISGIIGRYIYTAVPRGTGDDEPEGGSTEHGQRTLATERRALATWYSVHIPLTWALFVTATVHAGAALFYVTLQR